MVADAPFDCQADALQDLNTIGDYAKWMVGIATLTAPCFVVEKHYSASDQDTNTADHFATFHCKHAGDGGPVPPTHKHMDTKYVYFVEMNDEDKVVKMSKVWNDGFAFNQVGWM